MRKRNNTIVVRLNDGELEHLHRQLKRCDLPQETFLRMLIANKVPRETPPLEYYDMLKQLHAIGNNMNQIAARANSTGNIYVNDYADEVKTLREAILRIQAAVIAPDVGGSNESI